MRYVPLLEKVWYFISGLIVVYSKKIFSHLAEKKTIHVFDLYSTISQCIIITSPIGFNIALTNVDARLKRRCINVVPTLFQRCVTLFWRCFNVGHWHYINVVQRLKSDVGFCFIHNIESTIFQRWSTALKQRWSDVGMMAGFSCSLSIFSIKKYLWYLQIIRKFIRYTLKIWIICAFRRSLILSFLTMFIDFLC